MKIEKILRLAAAVTIMVLSSYSKAAEDNDELKCFLFFDPLTKVQRDVEYAVPMIVFSESKSQAIQATLNGKKIDFDSGERRQQVIATLASFKGANEGDSMDLVGKVTDGQNSVECKITVKVYDQACDSEQRQRPYAFTYNVPMFGFQARCEAK